MFASTVRTPVATVMRTLAVPVRFTEFVARSVTRFTPSGKRARMLWPTPSEVSPRNHS